MENNVVVDAKNENKKFTPKVIISFLAVVLAIAAVLVFALAPAIKIDQSYAFNEQVEAYLSNPTANANKQVFYDLRDWCYVVPGIAAIFGGGTYDVYYANMRTTPFNIQLQQDPLSASPMMIVGIVLAVIVAICYLVMILKQKKNSLLNKIITVGFIAAGLIIILSAVWFYAVNPIEESNFYDTVTKLDTGYKYMNAHLAWGPIVSVGLLVTSGVLTAFGEY